MFRLLHDSGSGRKDVYMFLQQENERFYGKKKKKTMREENCYTLEKI
jgi:hypothetical protein